MMELWMHGLGRDPDQGARLLRQMGFTAAVTGASQAEAAIAHGLDAYVCAGAYQGPDFTGDEWLAIDTKGRPQKWFSSTCPTREEVRKYNLEQIARMAGTPGIKGILIDGARFASPASAASPDCFYTCFCPSCRRKMQAVGFDPDALEQAVDALYDRLHGGRQDLHPYIAPLMDWFTFRRLATTEHLRNYADTVRSVDPDLIVGIYIFAPSLSTLVGQNYRDIDAFMDLAAPMLYRAYMAPSGPACLNVEASALMQMLDGAPDFDPAAKANLLRLVTGYPLNGPVTPQELRKGFSPDILRLETARASTMLKNSRLGPIVQLDDPALEESCRMTVEGGASLVNFFVFDRALIEANADFFERNRRGL